MSDTDELSYLKGDFIKLYHRIGESQWFWSQLLRTKELGFVNVNSVKDVVSFFFLGLTFFYLLNLCFCLKQNEKLHEFEPWYFESISKDEAGSILTNGWLKIK